MISFVKLKRVVWGLLLVNLFISAVHGQHTESIGTLEGSIAVGPTGQAGYNIPIEVPPGIAGMQPTLSISYNTLGGNSTLGVGWSISGFSSISRCRLTQVQDGKFDGVDYDSDDRYCLEGQKLVVVKGSYGSLDSEYRKEIDDFSKVVVTAVDATTGPQTFTVYTKSGLRYVYGGKTSARVHNENTSTEPVFEWKLNKIWDANGNYIEYHYYNDQTTGVVLPTAISYTGNQKFGTTNLTPSRVVAFKYSDENARPDKFVQYQAGAKYALTRRLDALETYITVANTSSAFLSQINPDLSTAIKVLEYNFNYTNADGSAVSPSSHRTRLMSIQQCGINTDATKLCYPATQFEYSGQDSTDPFVSEDKKLTDKQIPGATPATSERGSFSGDFNGDGIIDALVINGSGNVVIEWLDYTLTVQRETVVGNLPARPDDGTKHYYGDFNGDAYTDVLQYRYSDALIWANKYGEAKLFINKGYNGGIVAFQEEIITLPDLEGIYIDNPDEIGGEKDNVSPPLVADLNGDGLSDVLYNRKKCPSGYGCKLPIIYYRNSSGTAFEAGVEVDISGEKVADFNGDGLVDLYKRSDGILHVHFNLGDGARENVNLPAFGKEIVGDFNADGIADILFFTNSYGVITNRKTSSLYLGTGNNQFAKSTEVIHGLASFESSISIKPGDFNGDGATDLLVYKTSSSGTASDAEAYIYYSNGCSSEKNSPSDDLGCKFQRKTTDAQIDSWTFRKATSVTIADYNGDGLSDLYFIRRVADDPYIYLYLNSQTGYPDHEVFLQESVRTSGLDTIYFSVEVYPPEPYKVLPDMLQAVINGLGVESKLFYKPLTSDVYTKEHENTDPNNFSVQSSMYVVAHTEVSNGVGSFRVNDYHYSGAKYNRVGRGFLGFSNITIHDTQKKQRVVSTYSQSFPTVGRLLTAKSGLESVNNSGFRLIQKSQNIYAEENIGHGPGGGAPFTTFPYVRTSKTWTYDPFNNFSDEEITYTQTTTSYDTQNGESQSYGNASQIDVVTRATENATTNALHQVTRNYYSNDTTNWFLGRLWCSSVTEAVPNYPAETRHSAFEYYAFNGQLRKEIVEPSTLVTKIDGSIGNCNSVGDSALTLTTSHEYDATYGDSTETTISGIDIEPRTTTVTQNNSLRNAVLQEVTTTNALGHTTTQTIDTRWGAPAKQVDTDGEALRTEWQYNALGRLESETKFQQAPMVNLVTNIEYSPTCFTSPQYSAFQIKTTVTAGEQTEVCYDKLGRELASRTNGRVGVMTSSKTYDELGRVKTESRPKRGVWLYQYDALDRVRSTSSGTWGVSGAHTTNRYDGLNITTTTYERKRRTTVATINSLGQQIAVTRYLDDGDDVTSRYVYGPFGTLKKIIGPMEEEITYNYDVLGRKTKVHDLNLGQVNHIPKGLGSRFYEYYSTGELKLFEDAKGQVTENIYDKLGRLVKRIENKTSTSPITTDYEYDLAPGSSSGTWIGRLNKVTQNDTVFAYTFNTNGYPEDTLLNYSTDESYSTKVEYDEYGRVEYTTYPENGWKIQSLYDNYGRLTAYQDASNGNALLWRDDERNNAGQLIRSSLGNGLRTVRYYGDNSELMELETGLPSSEVTNKAVQHHKYRFDNLGNLLERTDARRSLTETFKYDTLDRLRFATVAQNRVEFRYNASGNLTFRSGLGVLNYDGNNGAGPHAVTSIESARGDINGSGGATAEDYIAFMQEHVKFSYSASTLFPARNHLIDADCYTDGSYNVVDAACIGRMIQLGPQGLAAASPYTSAFHYDNNGNLTSGGGRSITYTSYNKPDVITQERGNKRTVVDFDYTPEHNRLRKTTAVITNPGLPSETSQNYVTTYVGGLFDKTVKPDGTEAKFYLYADGDLVAVKTIPNNTPTSARIEYAHVDHLGSIEVFTNSEGNLINDTQTSFDAFGQRRNATTWLGSASGDFTSPEPSRGYTGHEQLDGLGLVHMNGRIYDPVIGRFMTADPFIGELYNSQNLNRYSYVFNNPLSYTDPSGYISLRDAVKGFVGVGIIYVTGGVGAAFVAAGYSGGTIVAGAVGGFIVAGMNGADMKGAAIGALTGGMFGALHYAELSGYQHSLAHGAVGGIGGLLSGEGFQSGFMSAAFTAHMGPAMDNVGGGMFSQAIMGAIVGGTAAHIGGGKFSNGAMTGSMSRMLNDCGSGECKGAKQKFNWKAAGWFAFDVVTFAVPAGWALKGVHWGSRAVSSGVKYFRGKNSAKGGFPIPKGTRRLGEWGEARLSQVLGEAGTKPTGAFKTAHGNRYIDRLVDGVAHEAKAGIDVALTPSIRKQIMKDVDLINTGQVRDVHWHFFQGAKSDTLDFLRQQGIKYTVH